MRKIVYATILIIEDSTVTRKTIMDGLKNFNLGFLEAVTGGAGLLMAQKSMPDVILLDLMLPDGNGYDYLQEIRKHPNTSKIPVIIITQSNLTQDVQKCLKGGAQYYLIKPLEIHKLLAAICKLLDVTDEQLSVNSLNRDKIIAEIKKAFNFEQLENKSATTYDKVDIGNLTPGMVVGIPVVIPGGKVLAAPESKITNDVIEEFKSNNVLYVYIKPKKS